MVTSGQPVSPGHLYGVGVGPGDPELMTLKAQRVITTCAVVAHFAARNRPGNAWTIVEDLVAPHQEVLRLEYPVTTEAVTKDSYESSIAAFYDESAARVAAQLDAGRDVAVICEGDPFLYGSYMYVHQRLASTHPTTVVPRVPAFAAATAATGRPLVSMDEHLTIVPAVRTASEMKETLASSPASVVMKVGRRLPEVVDAAEAVGIADRAVYVERASTGAEKVMPLLEARDQNAPYFSLVLFPGEAIDQRWSGR